MKLYEYYSNKLEIPPPKLKFLPNSQPRGNDREKWKSVAV